VSDELLLPLARSCGPPERPPLEDALRDLLQRALDVGVARAEIAALISRGASERSQPELPGRDPGLIVCSKR
jgi:hypothetical protein